MQSDDRLPILIPLAFIAVPVLIVIVAVIIFVRTRRNSKQLGTVPDGWVRAAGLVTDERTWRESRGTVTNPSSVFIRQPIVTYRTANGYDVTFTSTITGTFMPKPGAAVAVCHDPVDPSRARIAPESIPKANKAISVVATILVLVIGVPLVSVLMLVGVFLLRSR